MSWLLRYEVSPYRWQYILAIHRCRSLERYPQTFPAGLAIRPFGNVSECSVAVISIENPASHQISRIAVHPVAVFAKAQKDSQSGCNQIPDDIQVSFPSIKVEKAGAVAQPPG
jgi:hypothetical protein